MIKKFVLGVLVVLAGAGAAAVQVVHADGPPKAVQTWAWCGVHPDDPFAQTAARSMAVFGGIDATFGPCKDGSPGYSPANPGDRYVSPDQYMRVVQINASVGMKTIVYDARVWSTDPAVRTAAKDFWRPVYRNIAAWDMGDEFDPASSEWQMLVDRTNIVLSDVAVDSRVQPYTNYSGDAVDRAVRDVPGAKRMLSFDFYFNDGGEAIAKSLNAKVRTLMCAVDAFEVDSFHPTSESIRDTTDRLVRAGCDMILEFGGAQVYGSHAFGPKSIIDHSGEPTDLGTAALESTGYSSYVAVPPARLLETRTDSGASTVDGQSSALGVLPAGATTQLQVGGRAGVRADAAAAVLTVTAINGALPGFVTAFPCGTPQPNASQLTYAAAQVVATTVVAKLSTTGSVCLFNLTPTDLVVDVAGYFPPANTSFVAAQPSRLLDTRSGAGLTTVDGKYLGVGFRGAKSVTNLAVAGRADIPDDLSSATMSVTVTNARLPGFVSLYPCDQARPQTSSINFPAGAAVTTNTVVSAITGGAVCIYTSADIDLIIDLSGYTPTGSSFAALPPQRLLDSRTEVDKMPTGPGSVRQLNVAGVDGVPIDAGAVVLNLTVTGATNGGYVTVFPCGTTRPNTSIINFNAGDTVSNLVIAQVGANGSVCLFSSADPSYVIDLAGYHR
ncbi:MAG: hypothetical protein JWL72_2180 [Ilumatobacteraceae bacterium]|nr:hypothetical protein [Ilumatobacteraceae bacterium]